MVLLSLVFALSSSWAGSSIGQQLPASLGSAVTSPAAVDARTTSVPRKELHKIRVTGEGIGEDRSAWVWVPEGKGPFPVVLAIHGGKNRDGRDMTGRFAEAQRRGVMMVYPNGGDVPKGKGWVGPDKPFEMPADRDVRYFRALVHELQRDYPVDDKRMYVSGMSGGGYMADLLWCEMSDTFAGFGVVSRAMPVKMSQTCDVAKPRNYVLMLGTNDKGVVNEYQLPFDETRAFIRNQLRCPDQPVVRRTLPDKGDKLSVRHTRWTCAGGVTFDDYEVEGGGHKWPGSGKPSKDKTVDVDATEVILEAFGL